MSIIKPVTLYIVVTFIMASTWNLLLFKDVYASVGTHSMRQEIIIPLGLVSIFIEAFAVTFLFRAFFASSPTLTNAIKLAVLAGIFSVTYSSFTVPAKFEIEPISTYVLLEFTFGLLHYIGIGIVFYYLFTRAHGQAALGATS